MNTQHLYQLTRTELVIKYRLRIAELGTEYVRYPEWRESTQQEKGIWQEALSHLQDARWTLLDCAWWANNPQHHSVEKDTWKLYQRIAHDCQEAVEDPQEEEEEGEDEA